MDAIDKSRVVRALGGMLSQASRVHDLGVRYDESEIEIGVGMEGIIRLSVDTEGKFFVSINPTLRDSIANETGGPTITNEVKIL